MRILVTGSAGHLGEALARVLRSEGAGSPSGASGRREVVGLDVIESPFTDVVGSITDPDCVHEAMRGAHAVLHTATLHKPHVVTHSKQQFVDTNVSGTLMLLEAAVRHGVQSFVFTSSTSVFGEASRPRKGRPAAWITEDVAPVPKNIYGVTKLAAEELCRLFHKRHGLDGAVLRTSRFFPEDDDDRATRSGYDAQNAKVNELLFRRVDIEDAVHAHLLACERAEALGFATFIVSATTPFRPSDAQALRADAPAVVERYVPRYPECYARLGWRMFTSLDRVYVSDRARSVLGWKPKHDFAYAIERLLEGADPRSALALAVGAKGYHSEVFADGPYPVE